MPSSIATEASLPSAAPVSPAAGVGHSWREVLRRPLPGMRREPLTRATLRFVVGRYGPRVLDIEGLEHLDPRRDPAIVVMNHTTRAEALIVPSCLIFHRGGKRVQFIADWNSLLLPGVGWCMRRSGVIVVARKDAKPKWLNFLKPFYRPEHPPMESAKRILRAGGAVGIFPEGRAHRDPLRMLRGSTGAARLSLETGVPVVPVGIRFPEHEGLRPVDDSEKMRVMIGAPIRPPAAGADGAMPTHAVRDWHAHVMTAVAALAGKEWPHSAAPSPLSPS